MTQDTVKLLEENIKRNKDAVAVESALIRLEVNKDFQTVVVKGYLEQEAIRLVHLKADPSMQTAERLQSIDKQIDAIGGLLSYFRTIGHIAMQAKKAIESDEAHIEELLAEG